MNRRDFLKFSALAGVAAVMPHALRAQGGPLDQVYDTIVNDRGAHDRCIHLFGDSIARGYGTGVFADQMTGSEALYPFRSIASMARLVLADNRVPVSIGYGGNLSANLLARYVKSGIIRSGDCVVLEDAGNHGSEPDSYQEMWSKLRSAVVSKADVTCLMMTMFDYPAPGNIASNPDCQFDLPFNGRTMNQAIVAAAEADIDSVGQTLLLDMNGRMDDWKLSAESADGVAVMNPDGVHPNVWGQLLMTGEILKILGLRRYLRRCPTAQRIASAQVKQLKYGSRTFDTRQSAAYADYCLRR